MKAYIDKTTGTRGTRTYDLTPDALAALTGRREPSLGAVFGKIFDRVAAAIFALFGYEETQQPPSRVILPMNSGVRISPNTSAQVTSRPQNVAFRPERIVIGGHPDRWIVNDIKVSNRSQFAQSGDVPGEMFDRLATDSLVSFETVQTAVDFVILVTYVGPEAEGEFFVCGVLGTAAT